MDLDAPVTHGMPLHAPCWSHPSAHSLLYFERARSCSCSRAAGMMCSLGAPIHGRAWEAHLNADSNSGLSEDLRAGTTCSSVDEDLEEGVGYGEDGEGGEEEGAGQVSPLALEAVTAHPWATAAAAAAAASEGPACPAEPRGVAHAPHSPPLPLLCSLPDLVLHAHLWPRLGPHSRASLRATCTALRATVDGQVPGCARLVLARQDVRAALRAERATKPPRGWELVRHPRKLLGAFASGLLGSCWGAGMAAGAAVAEEEGHVGEVDASKSGRGLAAPLCVEARDLHLLAPAGCSTAHASTGLEPAASLASSSPGAHQHAHDHSLAQARAPAAAAAAAAHRAARLSQPRDLRWRALLGLLRHTPATTALHLVLTPHEEARTYSWRAGGEEAADDVLADPGQHRCGRRRPCKPAALAAALAQLLGPGGCGGRVRRLHLHFPCGGVVWAPQVLQAVAAACPWLTHLWVSADDGYDAGGGPGAGSSRKCVQGTPAQWAAAYAALPPSLTSLRLALQWQPAADVWAHLAQGLAALPAQLQLRDLEVPRPQTLSMRPAALPHTQTAGALAGLPALRGLQRLVWMQADAALLAAGVSAGLPRLLAGCGRSLRALEMAAVPRRSWNMEQVLAQVAGGPGAGDVSSRGSSTTVGNGTGGGAVDGTGQGQEGGRTPLEVGASWLQQLGPLLRSGPPTAAAAAGAHGTSSTGGAAPAPELGEGSNAAHGSAMPAVPEAAEAGAAQPTASSALALTPRASASHASEAAVGLAPRMPSSLGSRALPCSSSSSWAHGLASLRIAAWELEPEEVAGSLLVACAAGELRGLRELVVGHEVLGACMARLRAHGEEQQRWSLMLPAGGPAAGAAAAGTALAGGMAAAGGVTDAAAAAVTTASLLPSLRQLVLLPTSHPCTPGMLASLLTWTVPADSLPTLLHHKQQGGAPQPRSPSFASPSAWDRSSSGSGSDGGGVLRLLPPGCHLLLGTPVMCETAGEVDGLGQDVAALLAHPGGFGFHGGLAGQECGSSCHTVGSLHPPSSHGGHRRGGSCGGCGCSAALLMRGALSVWLGSDLLPWDVCPEDADASSDSDSSTSIGGSDGGMAQEAQAGDEGLEGGIAAGAAEDMDAGQAPGGGEGRGPGDDGSGSSSERGEGAAHGTALASAHAELDSGASRASTSTSITVHGLEEDEGAQPTGAAPVAAGGAGGEGASAGPGTAEGAAAGVPEQTVAAAAPAAQAAPPPLPGGVWLLEEVVVPEGVQQQDQDQDQDQEGGEEMGLQALQVQAQARQAAHGVLRGLLQRLEGLVLVPRMLGSAPLREGLRGMRTLALVSYMTGFESAVRTLGSLLACGQLPRLRCVLLLDLKGVEPWWVPHLASMSCELLRGAHVGEEVAAHAGLQDASCAGNEAAGPCGRHASCTSSAGSSGSGVVEEGPSGTQGGGRKDLNDSMFGQSAGSLWVGLGPGSGEDVGPCRQVAALVRAKVPNQDAIRVLPTPGACLCCCPGGGGAW